jgi:hypothetical protein
LLLFDVCPLGEKASSDAFKIRDEAFVGSVAVLNSSGWAIDVLASDAIDTVRTVTDTFHIDQFEKTLARVCGRQKLNIPVAGTSA